jgi:glycosyltransferase involved in cell wall biosynthesis
MNSVRRVLLATDTVGGVWTYSRELALSLADLGVEAVLAVMGPSPSADQLGELDGIHVIDTGLPLDWMAEGPGELRRAGCALAYNAAREGADIVQLCSAALCADVQFNQPVVAVQHSCVATWWASVHGGPLPHDFAWRRDLIEQGLNKANAVVAPTAAFAAQIVRAYDLDRAVLAVHNGRTPIPLRRRSSADFVLTVGRLWDEGKNIRTLGAAAAKLDVPVEAIGPLHGPNGTVITVENLHTPGPLPPAAVADRLSARPIYASTALYEPFGLSALEAAQAGCALVLSDIPTFRELWDDAALFILPSDSDGFADVIQELACDPERRERLGRASQLKALQYTPAAMARRMLDIYEQVLPQPEVESAPLQFADAE